MTPYLPSKSPDLQDMALDIYEKSAALSSKIHPITLRSLMDFLRIINTYYSNLIEDHHTHPLDIERAMVKRFDEDPIKRDFQIEAGVHVELERSLDLEMSKNPAPPTDPGFIQSIHRRFYDGLPDRFKKVPDIEGKSAIFVKSGEFRNHYVKVGRLVPIAPEFVEKHMMEFHRQYRLNRFSRVERLAAIAAAHHRLMWIHPFSDGNGRVARLFTGVCLQVSGLLGYGLWFISRGFARYKADYLAALADADGPRRGDLDGRGRLSQRGLDQFCKFFYTVCLDQLSFMGKMLELESLLPRIEQYIRLSADRLIPGGEPIRIEAIHLIREAFAFGEFPRGRAADLTGLGERTARNLLSEMIQRGLLVSDTPKGPVRLHFTSHLLPYWFPGLGPN